MSFTPLENEAKAHDAGAPEDASPSELPRLASRRPLLLGAAAAAVTGKLSAASLGCSSMVEL
jgi:hypothetical protein